MSRTQATTWIDMTDLASWHGHFTGIQRVVYGIAKGYYGDNNASFFSFNPKTKEFYEFDFVSFKTMIDSRNAEPSGDKPITPRKQKLAGKAKQAYLYAPSSIKRVLTPHRLKKAARLGYRYYKSAAILKQTIAPRVNNKQSGRLVSFSTADKVLILGNSWDRPELLIELGNKKRTNNFKIFQVVYDLIAVYEPQAFDENLFKAYTKNLFEVATISDGLMAISESTKRDMQRYCTDLNIECPPVEVIRLGDDIMSSDNPTRPPEFNTGDKFVLCVGTIEARKNHTLLYYAWKEGLLKGEDMPRLVIVGRPGWYTGDIIHSFQNDPQMINKVTILNNASDDELVWLYANCLFTVYPSYSEGWGLPVAESLAMGKVCLTSNVSSMPEIGGSLCEYGSPYNSQECLEGVVRLLDNKYRTKLEKRITESYTQQSWTDTYKQSRLIIDRR